MTVIPFGEWRPDITDFSAQNISILQNAMPRGDGYGPFPDFAGYSSALPGVCRGFFKAIKTDGSVLIFAATSTGLYQLNNSTFGWTPVSSVVALTSISNASPAVFTLNSHGRSNGDTLVLSTSGALPTGLTVGTVYYVINAATNTFQVSLTSGGTAVNTSSAGSGTHSMTNFYSALTSTDNWQFVQYINFVIAVQANVAPQVFDLTSSSAFATLGGSPPQARYIAIVGSFVVLSGLLTNPYRVQWSALGDPTGWTSGVNSSSFQDLPDGGIVRGVAGGEFGNIFQDTAIRRLIYAPGNPVIFQIQRISDDRGLYAPYSLIRSGDQIFFIGPQGFQQMDPAGYPVPIGKEKVDRTFFADVDKGNLQLVIGASDPRNHRVFWAYKSNSGIAGLFDKIMCYDYVLKRFAPVAMVGEYLGSLSQPGLTLENIDTISSSIDALIPSLDSFATSVSPEIAAFNSSHVLGFFRGSNLAASMETGAQELQPGRRMFVRSFRPITDAPTVFGSVGTRERLDAAEVITTEQAMDTAGQVPQRASTRFARGRVRIPAGTIWSFASGVEPEAVLEGER